MSALSQFFGSGTSFQDGIYQQEVYDSSNTFVVPQTGKYLITAVGAGGSGGAGAFTMQGAYSLTPPNTSNSCGGASGGGAGGFSQSLLTLEAGTVLNITVGAGGSAITHPGVVTSTTALAPSTYAGANGSAGGNTTVTNTGGSVTVNMIANGGGAGLSGQLKTSAGSSTEVIGGLGGTATGGNLFNLTGQQGGNSASVTFNTDGQRVQAGGDGGTVNGIAKKLPTVPRAPDGVRAPLQTVFGGGAYAAAEHTTGVYSVYFPNSFRTVPSSTPYDKSYSSHLNQTNFQIDLGVVDGRFLESYKLSKAPPNYIGTQYVTPLNGFRSPTNATYLYGPTMRHNEVNSLLSGWGSYYQYMQLSSETIHPQLSATSRHGAFVGGIGGHGTFINGVSVVVQGNATTGRTFFGSNISVSYGAGSGGTGGVVCCLGTGDNTTNSKMQFTIQASTTIVPAGGNGFVVIEYMLK